MQMAPQSRQDIYRIRGSEADWHVELNSRTSMAYASKQAAFEAAVASASEAIRDGHEVVIVVPAMAGGESSTGADELAGVSWSSLT